MKNILRSALILLAIVSQAVLFGVSASNADTGNSRPEAFLTKGPPIPDESMYAPWASTRRSKTPSFNISWCGNTSATVDFYTIKFRMGNSAWSDLIPQTTGLFHTFVGSPGRTYYFRSRATNTNGTIRWSSLKRTIVPYDDRQLVYKKFGWRGSVTDPDTWFYLGTVTYSKTKDQAIVYKFRGKTVSLISTKGPDRSKAKIYIDGVHRKTIDAYDAERKWRYRVFSAEFPKGGVHYIKIVNLATPGRTRFDIDALAVGR